MMFHKSLVSFVAVMALASGVAVSANLARSDDPFYPPPLTPSTPVSQCNTGSECCNTLTSTSNPAVTDLSAFLPEGTIIDPKLAVGLSCYIIGSNQPECSSNPVCCTGRFLSGLISIGCTPIRFGL
ncbi:hypothetical protein EDB84DRAFT_1509688 [Lactarius hengduanensis]|nr:hypothetical protein EDB84DRAFT_1509688 [Lactarius hengduanensis]